MFVVEKKKYFGSNASKFKIFFKDFIIFSCNR